MPTSTLHPNPHYVSKMGLIDMTHWRTYLLIGTLGSSVEFTFGCFFVALPFVALELRRHIAQRRDEENKAVSDEGKLSTMTERLQKYQKKPFVMNPILGKVIDGVSTALLAPIGVALLRVWRGEPAWDATEGVNAGVDGVSYRYAIAAMVLGKFLWLGLGTVRRWIFSSNSSSPASEPDTPSEIPLTSATDAKPSKV